MKIENIFLLAIALIITVSCGDGKSKQNQQEEQEQAIEATVRFHSSDPELQAAWDWAKEKALTYVRQGDPVGPWYEASLPGRDAFCMRDVAHMSTGAAVLGLDEQTKNMLKKFAENVSDSKDWCSYWEINSQYQPAPVDYVDDKDFWYNLPANYDVMDACFRMFLWTGDQDYVKHRSFVNFYGRTTNDYTYRWSLQADSVLYRNRIMNLPEGATPESHKFYDKRGIPGYYEAAGGRMLVGVDLLAVMYAANNWFQHYVNKNKNDDTWLKESDKIKSIIENVFWDEEQGRFRLLKYTDGTFGYDVDEGSDFAYSLLQYKAIDDPVMVQSVLNSYSLNKTGYNIEIASYLPNIFFKNERPEDGIYMLKYLADKSTARRDYPENSFAIVGAFVTGLMGINPTAPNEYIGTYSGIKDPNATAMVSNLPVIGKEIDLMHRGRHTSILRNHSDEPIYWAPYLYGEQESWFINGKEEKGFGKVIMHNGFQVTSFLIKVQPGTSASVSAYPPPEPEDAGN
jgi:hypothetical protein